MYKNSEKGEKEIKQKAQTMVKHEVFCCCIQCVRKCYLDYMKRLKEKYVVTDNLETWAAVTRAAVLHLRIKGLRRAIRIAENTRFHSDAELEEVRERLSKLEALFQRNQTELGRVLGKEK